MEQSHSLSKYYLKLYFCSLAKKDLTSTWCVLHRCLVSCKFKI